MNIKWFRFKRLITWERVIVLLLVVVSLVVSGFVIRCSSWSGPTSSIATLGLLVIAILGAMYAKRNIEAINLNNRNQLFLQLMNSLGESKSRNYRGIIYEIHDELVAMIEGKGFKRYYTVNMKPISDTHDGISKIIDMSRERLSDEQTRDAGEAIEETVALLDRVGFFILHGKDKMLVKDAPTWIWSMCNDMDKIVGGYVRERQKKPNQQNYGRYFVELAEKAKIMIGGNEIEG